MMILYVFYILESSNSILIVQCDFRILNAISFSLNKILWILNFIKQIKIDIKDIFLIKW
jgi:hypothetical protein